MSIVGDVSNKVWFSCDLSISQALSMNEVTSSQNSQYFFMDLLHILKLFCNFFPVCAFICLLSNLGLLQFLRIYFVLWKFLLLLLFSSINSHALSWNFFLFAHFLLFYFLHKLILFSVLIRDLSSRGWESIWMYSIEFVLYIH